MRLLPSYKLTRSSWWETGTSSGTMKARKFGESRPLFGYLGVQWCGRLRTVDSCSPIPCGTPATAPRGGREDFLMAMDNGVPAMGQLSRVARAPNQRHVRARHPVVMARTRLEHVRANVADLTAGVEWHTEVLASRWRAELRRPDALSIESLHRPRPS